MQKKAIPWMGHDPASLYGSRNQLCQESRVFRKIKIQRLNELTVKRSSDFINDCQDGKGLRTEKTRWTDLTEKVCGPAHELAFWGRRSYYGVNKTYILQIMKAQHYK